MFINYKFPPTLLTIPQVKIATRQLQFLIITKKISLKKYILEVRHASAYKSLTVNQQTPGQKLNQNKKIINYKTLIKNTALIKRNSLKLLDDDRRGSRTYTRSV